MSQFGKVQFFIHMEQIDALSRGTIMRRTFGKLLGPSFLFASQLPFDEAYAIIENNLQNKLIREEFQRYPVRKVSIRREGHGRARFSVTLASSMPPSSTLSEVRVNGWLIADGKHRTVVKGRGLISPFVGLILLVFLAACPIAVAASIGTGNLVFLAGGAVVANLY